MESVRYWPWKKFDVPEQSELPIMEVSPSTSTSETSTSFVPVRPRQTSGKFPVIEADEGSESDGNEESGETLSAVNLSKLFT